MGESENVNLLVETMLFIFVLSYYVYLRYDFCIKTMFGSSLPPVVCRSAHVLFSLFVFVCAWWCSTHIVLCFCLCSSSLPVSLDCPFLIAPSAFSNAYVNA